MKHPFLLWLALLFSLMTATSRADHFKGGALSWQRLTAEPGFKVQADVTVSFDLSSPFLAPTDQNTPKVNGMWVYTPEMPVSTSCEIEWGDGSTNTSLNQFKVVTVDFAAQIVTLQATNEADLKHPYATNGTYTMAILGYVRDHDEELANRQSSVMRVESTVDVHTTTPSPNKPPAFNLGNSKLVIVPRQDPNDPTMTFQAPVAIDPNGDTVKYSFVASEGNATHGASGDSWEADNGLTITDAGVISWDTSDIEQTIKTYTIQVVATDYDSMSNPKSRSAIEFQVWVNDPDQDGVPVMELAPDFTTFAAVPGQLFQLRILGTDHSSLGEIENSRLEAVIPSGDMPAGAVLVPSGGFAGEDADPESDDHHGTRMEAVFSWTPTSGQANTSFPLHIKVKDDDGNFSTERVVTINVGSTGTLQPLQLTVTPGTEGEDEDGKPVINVVGRPGDDLTFTVAASTATAGTDVKIYTFDHHLPGSAEMDPALPVLGTNSSVSSEFTWEDLTEDDLTPATVPHEITFFAGDEYGREVSRKVHIYVLPVLPTIELAAGEPTTFEKELWKTITFQFNVTGHGDLQIQPEVGMVDENNVTAPHTGTFTWRILPGQLKGGDIRLKVTDTYGQEAILTVPVTLDTTPSIPTWWTSRNVLTGGDAQDFGVATQGQLKTIASKAYAELLANDPTLATLNPEGVELDAYIDGFSETEGNYSPVAQGQVKHAADLFYKVLARRLDKEIGIPWTENQADDVNHAPASVGQVKAIFSFPLPYSNLFNDLPEVTLTSPTNGQGFVNPATILLQATASDPDGSIASVVFKNGTTTLNTDTSPPYQFSWGSVGVGTYNITAVATDNRGATRTSEVASIVVNPVVDPHPTVSITSPANNTHYATPAQIPISSTASDNGSISKVIFKANGVTIATINGNPFPFTWNNVVASGTYALTAHAFDNLGQETVSSPINVIVDAPIPGTTNLVLRYNVNSYWGVRDVHIRSDHPTTNYENIDKLRIDRDLPDSAALMKWDLTKIPTTATVTAVNLTFKVTNNNASEQFEIYAMRRPWSSGTASWRRTGMNATETWATFGAASTSLDRETAVLGSLYAPTMGATITIPFTPAGVSQVQEWIEHPETNLGFTIQDYAGGNVGAAVVYSSEAFDEANRPSLQIFYE